MSHRPSWYSRLGIRAKILLPLAVGLCSLLAVVVAWLGAEQHNVFLEEARSNARDTAALVEGISEGCVRSGAALIGGETAEMPGMYPEGDFDLAGFAVGAMERGTELPRDVGIGDVLFGLPSDGVHSNGYSLVRKIVDLSGLGWDDASPFGDGSLGAALLTPTNG